MSHFSTHPPRFRLFGLLAALALIFGATPIQDEAPEGEAPIEVVIVQGFVKSIDTENLVLTAPGAPHDLPLLLHPDTRYVNGEEDVSREDVKEGQFVRAALIPSADGSDLLAIVVEIVPDEEATPPPSAPPGDPGTLGEPDPPIAGPQDPDTTEL